MRNTKSLKVIENFSTKSLFGIERSQLRKLHDAPIVFLDQEFNPQSHVSLVMLNNYFKKLETQPTFNISKIDIEKTKKSHLGVDNKIECFYCKNHIELSKISLDHYIPQHFGGRSHYHNLKLSCDSCNKMKGAIHPELMPVSWKIFKDNLFLSNEKPKALQILEQAKEKELTEIERTHVLNLIEKEIEWRLLRKAKLESKQLPEVANG